MLLMTRTLPIEALQAEFGGRLQEGVTLARYTSARIGGPADALIEVHSADDLAEVVTRLWELEAPFVILGGGSNVLVSDKGVREVVLLNRARRTVFDTASDRPTIFAESGASFGALARQAAQKGFSGLEWAAGIPGTVGGAVFGNAGAHSGDVLGNLVVAEILHRQTGRQTWPVGRFAYSYRDSVLKRQPGQAVVLSATFQLAHGDPTAIKGKMDENLAFRRRTQPPGASMGSMFKNPEEDYAGRLIDAAGLKGKQIGQAQISPLHANFFINHGDASAADVMRLIELAKTSVKEQFEVELELEIELVGEWSEG